MRIRAVREPAPASAGKVELKIVDERLALLRVPFAVIARIRNEASAPLELTISLDGSRICAEKLPADARRRADCSVVRDWTRQPDHQVSIAGPVSPWTLEYLELATHHGRSTGLFEAIVLPVDSRLPRPNHLVDRCLGRARRLFSLEPRPLASRALRTILFLMVSAAIALFAIVLLLPLFSSYRVVIAHQTFVAIVLLTTLPRTLPVAGLLIPADMRAAALTRIQLWCLAHQRSLVLIFAALTTVSAGVYGTRAVGGADEYAYVSQAELWLHGSLKIDQPFVRQTP